MASQSVLDLARILGSARNAYLPETNGTAPEFTYAPAAAPSATPANFIKPVRDEKGCLLSAGYAYCQTTDKCAPIGQCPVAPPALPAYGPSPAPGTAPSYAPASAPSVAPSYAPAPAPSVAPSYAPASGEYGKKDVYGCRPSAGQSWCASLGKCVQPWVETCPAAPSPSPYEPPAPAPAPVVPSRNENTGRRDARGCIPSAGYGWCESLGKCTRPWEEVCPAPYAPGPSPYVPSPMPGPYVPSPMPGPYVPSPMPGPYVPSPMPGPYVPSPMPGPYVPSPMPGPYVPSPVPGPYVPSPMPGPYVPSPMPGPYVPSPVPGPYVPSPMPGPYVPSPMPGPYVPSPMPGPAPVIPVPTAAEWEDIEPPAPVIPLNPVGVVDNICDWGTPFYCTEKQEVSFDKIAAISTTGPARPCVLSEGCSMLSAGECGLNGGLYIADGRVCPVDVRHNYSMPYSTGVVTPGRAAQWYNNEGGQSTPMLGFNPFVQNK